MTVSHPIKSPRKLIEVALPLDAINTAAAAEKLIKVGKPTNLHLWWARRPLAAARAIVFAQLVNDPGFQQGGGFKYGRNKKEAAAERKRLFGILEKLVKWENTTNEQVLEAARQEIRRSWREVCELNRDHPEAGALFNPEVVPGLHDPFAGGGVIPLEAQRLGLRAFATDLNPVAVLINKALIEIPPLFAGQAPIGPLPHDRQGGGVWTGATGLAEDIRRYGTWVREAAARELGRLYPEAIITDELARLRPSLKALQGKRLRVIAWLWARAVRSPSPAFSHVQVPLVSNFILSSKADKQVFLEPVVKADTYRFRVCEGMAPTGAGEGTRASVKGGTFRCILSDTPISGDYIKSEAIAGRITHKLLAVVADGPRGRVYIDADVADETLAAVPRPAGLADSAFFAQALGFRIGNYGMSVWADLFTARQLTALDAFVRAIRSAHAAIVADGVRAGLPAGAPLRERGTGANAYADAICVYLSLAMSRMADWGNSLTRWESKAQVPQQLFGRHAIPMVWDFCEPNPLSESTGSYAASIANIEASFKRSSAGCVSAGVATQADARTQSVSRGMAVSTDPPYYDNIGYADLSDFFYVWLRPALRDILPDLFATIAVPKVDELVATPARHGGPAAAEAFFLAGMTDALRNISTQAHPEPPMTIYYAFKQSETTSDEGTSSTGWETFLEAVWRAGLQITGTWPMRMENSSRMRGQSSNALASSIVLVCRRRALDAPTVSRRELVRELNVLLPEALDGMTRGGGDDKSPVAPVDLSQAIIGPGMAVFSKYSAVLEADGSSMSVKTALQLINRFLAEDDFDHDTQFCLHWFDQHGWGEGAYGEADVLARAKATSVSGLSDAGVVKSGAGKVRLLRPNEYPSDWDPKKDPRLPIWEALHQLVRALRDDGETGAGLLLAAVKPKSEAIRQLAYRLYTLCERRGWAEDARAYNELVTSWSAVEAAAGEVPDPNEQLKLFGGKK